MIINNRRDENLYIYEMNSVWWWFREEGYKKCLTVKRKVSIELLVGLLWGLRYIYDMVYVGYTIDVKMYIIYLFTDGATCQVQRQETVVGKYFVHSKRDGWVWMMSTHELSNSIILTY